jgi:2-dehydro-3-deoxygluconokinase
MAEDGAAATGPRFDVTSLGESLIRFSVPPGTRLAAARNIDIHVAGAESNVCGALAGLGRRCGWVSRLPDNPLGQLVLRRLREQGIDLGAVRMTPHGRVGVYFVELAATPLPIRVTYDRAASAFSTFSIEEVPWDYLLDTRVLHLTGITVALGRSCHGIVAEAIARAKERGVVVSFDVNYRAQLWSESDAAAALRPLVRDADLLLCGRKDALRVFGASGDGDPLLDQLQEISGARHIVVSREEHGAIARSDGRTLHQPAIPVEVIDRIGAGDAFAAGVIDGLVDGSIDAGLATGSALAAIAMTLHGDTAVATRDEVASIAQGVSREVLR